MKLFSSLALKYDGTTLLVLDQRKLPREESWLKCHTPEEMSCYIKQLSVRGAPLIGIAAATALALYAEGGASDDNITRAARQLKSARPTAVNLAYAIDKLMEDFPLCTKEGITRRADEIIAEEYAMSCNMSGHGAALIASNETILTHCNTGGLVTNGPGTALGAVIEAHRQGKKVQVYVDETRPLLQGGRLTTWELEKEGIPYTLICDNMAASLMAKGVITRVMVGADRIAINGDFANKIGTYSVAVNAHYHNVPFHIVAPVSTIDFQCANGQEIPIEERAAGEVRGASGCFGTIEWSPENAPVYNPSFDVTPACLVTSHVLDSGVYTQKEVKEHSLKTLCQRQQAEV
ncbi:S-methyl-5-thioribose-1-phosphate isomerase [Simkania negevensis]|uniref:S-methyl-5-thioribose-1-phosphate isomerase n=1 Tax=Simkania negevensis TaxID=83561 RepID=A0ABS3APE3_9BACT|nr:S-methyl-5-thioribose-1-phosphate isomerase [Simkania negevensis]